jgi:hypothetical protein
MDLHLQGLREAPLEDDLLPDLGHQPERAGDHGLALTREALPFLVRAGFKTRESALAALDLQVRADQARARP